MDNAARWLHRHGLAKYAQVFADNEITLADLHLLTDADLRELGLPMGPRKRFLAATAAPAATEAEVTPSDDQVLRPTEAAAPPLPELRQVTVLFADLVGSTDLSQRLDPEDLREVNRGYQEASTGAIERFGGYLARYMGDGVLAYFGYPEAHENDAERSIRAALEIVRAVRALRPEVGRDPPLELSVRVGIATGPVIAGDLVGEGAARESTVVGETPNLAARLQALAEPNTVLIGPRTRALAGEAFELASLGNRSLKGLSEPVPVWRAVRELAGATRFGAHRSDAALTPLVGRDEEIALLERRWEQARTGAGRVVLLIGEPGIGKSRLTEELRRRVDEQPHRELRFDCASHHQHSALQPAIAHLQGGANITGADPPEARLDKLRRFISPRIRDERTVALLAEVLSIPVSTRSGAPPSTPQQRKRLLLEALEQHVLGIADEAPALVILEDLHWIDATSLELLDRLVDRLTTRPMLLLTTSRPGFTAPWLGAPHVTTLNLNRLDPRSAGEIARRVAKDRRLPAAAFEQIVAHTDGVPLFVEELTKNLLEASASEAGRHAAALPAATDTLAVPITLQGSLMARLDRLSDAKEVAQLGAAIGRSFSHELISASIDRGEHELRAMLARLVDAELLSCRGDPPQATYTFNHALVRDAAYGTLLRSRRRAVHARIANALCTVSPDLVESQPEVVGHHSLAAGEFEDAVAYFRLAGERASRSSSHTEAVAHFETALRALEHLPDSSGRAHEELRVLTGLGPAQVARLGWSSPEAGKTYTRARALSREIDDVEQQFSAAWGLIRLHNTAAEYAKARELAEELEAVAEETGDLELTLAAHAALGTVAFLDGSLAAAHAHFERGLDLYDERRHAELAVRYGFDLRLMCLSRDQLCVWLLGDPDRATRMNRELIEASGRSAHIMSRALSLEYSIQLHDYMGSVRPALDESAALLAMARRYGFSTREAHATFLRGQALLRLGRYEEAVTDMRAGSAMMRSHGVVTFRPGMLASRGEAEFRLGRINGARSLLVNALASAESTGQRVYLPEIHRLLGEVLADEAIGDRAGAEHHFRAGIEASRSLGARSLELRAATGLARLWERVGERAGASELLCDVCDGFTEGTASPDLQEAWEILDRLS